MHIYYSQHSLIYAIFLSKPRHILQMSKGTLDHKPPSPLKISTQTANSRASSNKHGGIRLLPTRSAGSIAESEQRADSHTQQNMIHGVLEREKYDSNFNQEILFLMCEQP